MSDDAKKDEQNEPKRHNLFNQRSYQGFIEQQIQQAMNDGKFNNLPGQGKPLPKSDDENVPEELRAGFRMLKANGFAPHWIEARKDIDEERAKVANWLAQHQTHWASINPRRRAELRTEYHGKLRDLHRAILNYNLRLPPGVPQIENINIERELQRLEA